MSAAGLVQDTMSFTLQGLVAALAAIAAQRLLPIDRPTYRLAFWRAVLASVLVLPFFAPPAAIPGRFDLRWESSENTREGATAPAGMSWGGAAAVLLVAGILFRMGRLAHGAASLRACRGRARIADLASLDGLFEITGARAEIRVSTDVAVPATFGLKRPLVLLPESVLRMAIDRQRAVVAHELIHVRRRDWAFSLLEELLSALLWFHPAIPFLVRRIRLAREQCVDVAVIEAIGGRQAYLESLIEVAQKGFCRTPVPAALFLGEHHLSERVEHLLKEVVMSKIRALCHLSVGALVLLLAGAVASASFPLSAGGRGGSEKAARPAGEAKSKVNEPRIVHKVAPVYPEDAKKERLQGIVHVDVRLAKDGAVAEAKAVDGHATLAEAALAAVRQWRYEPVLGPDKKPVEAKLTITINFRLD